MKVEADTLIRVTAFSQKNSRVWQAETTRGPSVEGKKNKPKYLQKGG